MTIVESLRNMENQLMDEKDEFHDLVGAYLTSNNISKYALIEMLKRNDIKGVVKLLEGVDTFDDDDFDEPVGEYPWAFVTSKSVKDFDGFWTDYSMWREVTMDDNGNPKMLDHFVFIFGDNDVYNPHNSEPDWECDSVEEAQEWFDNYEGFEDEDIDESLNKSLNEDKSFAMMNDNEIKSYMKSNMRKSDEEYLNDYLDEYNAQYEVDNGKHIIHVPGDDDIEADSFEDLMYDVKYTLHEIGLEESFSKKLNKRLTEALKKGAIDRAVRVLQGNRKNLLKEDYYTVKYSYYTNDDQIESNSVTFGDAQSAKDLSDELKNTLKGNLIHLDWDIEDEDQPRDWELLDRKTITDFDGFTTDYTLWKKNNEDYWVCVFGDSDIYGPEDGEFNAEFETEREAREWFNSYSGFEDDELEFAHEMESETELATDDMNAGQWYENLDKKNLKEGFDNAKAFIESAMYQYEQDPDFYNLNESKSDCDAARITLKKSTNPKEIKKAQELIKKCKDKDLKEASIVQSVNSFRRMLDRFNENGKSAKSGDWSIAKGGYDLDFEVYHKGTPVIDCVNGELEILTNKEKYLPIAKTITNIYKDTHLAENLQETLKGSDIDLEMPSIGELVSWLKNHQFNEPETINIEVNNGRNSYSYFLYWTSPRTNVGSYPIIQIDRNDRTLFSKEGPETPSKEVYKKFVEESIAFLETYTKNFNESLKEYIDSTILSDETLSLIEEGDHLVNGNEDWQILEIEVYGNRYMPKSKRTSFHVMDKNGGKMYKSAKSFYGYKIIEK